MENSINKVELQGYVGKDPEIKKVGNGTVAKFTMATNESYKGRNGEWVNEATWHQIVAWNKMAEEVELHVKKGVKVNVNGKISNRSYSDKDGHKHYITEVQMNSLKLVENTDEAK